MLLKIHCDRKGLRCSRWWIMSPLCLPTGKKNHFKRNYNCGILRCGAPSRVLQQCGCIMILTVARHRFFLGLTEFRSLFCTGLLRLSVIKRRYFVYSQYNCCLPHKKNTPLISQGQPGLPFWVAQSAARQGKRPSPCGAAAALLRRVRCPSVQGSVVHSDRGSENQAGWPGPAWTYGAI